MKTFAPLACWLLLAQLSMAFKPGMEDEEMPPPAPGDSLQTLYDKANEADNFSDFERAVDCWTIIIQRRPADATALLHRAAAYESIEDGSGDKNDDNALADLTNAIGIDANYVDAFIARGNLYLKQRHNTKALADFSEAIRIAPTNLAAYRALAVTYSELGEVEKAVAVYDDEVCANPKNIDAFMDRGVFCWRQYPDKAIADFTEAIRLDPKLVMAYDRRAYTYASKGDWDNAIADYTTVIRLAPAGGANLWSSPYKSRAEAYANKKQWDEALADLNKLIASEDAAPGEPGDVDYDAYVARGDTQRAKGDYAHALVDYTMAINSDEAGQADRDTAHAGRGETYWAMGQKEKAIADFTRAVELHLYGGDCVRLARAEFDTGQFDKAIAHCTLGIVRCEEGVDAYVLRAAAHAAKGEDKLAAESFREALDAVIGDCQKSKWKNAGDIDALAAVESRVGKFDMAVRHQQMALDLARDDKKTDAGLLKKMEDRLALYQQQKPWLEEKQPR